MRWVLLIFAALAAAGVSFPAEAQPRAPRAHDGACAPSRDRRCASAEDALAAANSAARQRPARGAFSGARQVFAYAPGALYELNTRPGFVSSVLLEPGETLVDIAAGDTARWSVTDATAGAMSADTGYAGRTLVLVKPLAPGVRTNIVLITDRRTYLIEARAGAGAYAAEIAWSYPADLASAPSAARPLNAGYRARTVRGKTPAWAPVSVVDDGRRTIIAFPPEVIASDLPPLFIIGPEGPELANGRVAGTRMIVDRIFDVAELRLGSKRQTIVRIERRAPRRRAP